MESRQEDNYYKLSLSAAATGPAFLSLVLILHVYIYTYVVETKTSHKSSREKLLLLNSFITLPYY